MKKGFTLIELLIGIGIIGMLFVVLFRAYTTISQVTFRIQQEKSLQQEMIRIAQTLQNIADTHSIDFEKQPEGLNQTQLFLSWEMGRIILTSQWICYSATEKETISEEEQENPCRLVLIDEQQNTTTINSPKESILSTPYFYSIPYKQNEEIINNDQYPFLRVQHPAFWVHFTLYSPIYKKENRTNNSKLIFQQFFNLQQ